MTPTRLSDEDRFAARIRSERAKMQIRTERATVTWAKAPEPEPADQASSSSKGAALRLNASTMRQVSSQDSPSSRAWNFRVVPS